MPLPTEVMLFTLGGLPRDSLDSVSITNRALVSICDTGLSEYPLRPVTLAIDCPSGNGTIRNTSSGLRRRVTLDDIDAHLRHAMVKELILSGSVNVKFLERLLPYADHFRTATLTHHCHWERKFESAEAFFLAYNEIFFCRHMEFERKSLRGALTDANAHENANAALLTLPGVQQCSSLVFESLSLADAGDISEWLASGGDKTLQMKFTPLVQQNTFLLELTERVLEDFRTATTSTNFTVKMIYNARGASTKETKIYENATTSEKLVVSVERIAYGHAFVHTEASITRSEL
ncbi:hypothetical protein AAVH_11953 [Aphelenchoides avenae]|nr:hypothetical protein AAVH_11953 [Aphelenchus avenae]